LKIAVARFEFGSADFALHVDFSQSAHNALGVSMAQEKLVPASTEAGRPPM
jgi:hypothetical protein